MAERSLNRNSLRWLVLEGFAVVLSILLAFAIDAWWEGRQKSDDERVILRSLLDDLVEKRTLLAYEIKFNQTILESATKLLHAGTNAEQKMSNDDIDRLIGFTWWYNDSSIWDSAALNSLIIGGGFSSISDQHLLQQISLLQTSIGEIKNRYQNDEDFHRNVLTPFFISNVNLPQIANAIEHSPGHPEVAYIFPDFEVSAPYDHSELLSKVEFQSLMVAKIDAVVDLSRGHVGLGSQIDEVTKRINAELSN